MSLTFMTQKCLQGPWPHFSLKCKHLPPELDKSPWSSITISTVINSFPKAYSQPKIQSFQQHLFIRPSLQMHKNIFSTHYSQPTLSMRLTFICVKDACLLSKSFSLCSVKINFSSVYSHHNKFQFNKHWLSAYCVPGLILKRYLTTSRFLLDL